jgi:uncharacterized protein (UPF0261 family)
MATVLLIGTFDTKGDEYGYLSSGNEPSCSQATNTVAVADAGTDAEGRSYAGD